MARIDARFSAAALICIAMQLICIARASAIDIDLRQCVSSVCTVDQARVSAATSDTSGERASLVLSHASSNAAESAPVVNVTDVRLESVLVVPGAADAKLPMNADREVPSRLQLNFARVVLDDAISVHVPLHSAVWSGDGLRLEPSTDSCRRGIGVGIARFHGGVNMSRFLFNDTAVIAPIANVSCSVSDGVLAFVQHVSASWTSFSFSTFAFKRISSLRGFVGTSLSLGATGLTEVSLLATDVTFEQGRLLQQQRLDRAEFLTTYRTYRVNLDIRRITIVAPAGRVQEIVPVQLSSQFRFSVALLSNVSLSGICVHGAEPPSDDFPMARSQMNAFSTALSLDATCGSWVEFHRTAFTEDSGTWPFHDDVTQRRPFVFSPATAVMDTPGFGESSVIQQFALLRATLHLRGVTFDLATKDRSLVGRNTTAHDGNVLHASRVLGDFRCEHAKLLRLDGVVILTMGTSRLIDVNNGATPVAHYRGVVVEVARSIFQRAGTVNDAGRVEVSQSVVVGNGDTLSQLPQHLYFYNLDSNAVVVVSESVANSTLRVLTNSERSNISIYLTDNIRAPLIYLTHPGSQPKMSIVLTNNTACYGIRIENTKLWSNPDPRGMRVSIAGGTVGVRGTTGPLGHMMVLAVRQFSISGLDPLTDGLSRDNTLELRDLVMLRGIGVRASAVTSVNIDNVTVEGLSPGRPRILSTSTNASSLSLTGALRVTLTNSWFETYSMYYAINVTLSDCRGEHAQVRPLRRTVYVNGRREIDYPMSLVVRRFVAEQSSASERFTTFYVLDITNSSVTVEQSTIRAVQFWKAFRCVLSFQANTFVLRGTPPSSTSPFAIGFRNNEFLYHSTLSVCGLHLDADSSLMARMPYAINLQTLLNSSVDVRGYSEEWSTCQQGAGGVFGPALVGVKSADGVSKFHLEGIRSRCMKGLRITRMRGSVKPAGLEVSITDVVAISINYSGRQSEFVYVGEVASTVPRTQLVVTNVSWEVLAAEPLALHCVGIATFASVPNGMALAFDVAHSSLTAASLGGNVSGLPSYVRPPCKRSTRIVGFEQSGSLRRLDARVLNFTLHAHPPMVSQLTEIVPRFPLMPLVGLGISGIPTNPNATRISLLDVALNVSEVLAQILATADPRYFDLYSQRLPPPIARGDLPRASVDLESWGWLVSSCVRHVNGTPAIAWSSTVDMTSLACAPTPQLAPSVCSVAAACPATTAASSARLAHPISALVHADGTCGCRCGGPTPGADMQECPALGHAGTAKCKPRLMPDASRTLSHTPRLTNSAGQSISTSRSQSVELLPVAPPTQTSSVVLPPPPPLVPGASRSASHAPPVPADTELSASTSVDVDEPRPSPVHYGTRSISVSPTLPLVANDTEVPQNQTTAVANAPRDAALSQSATSQVGASVTLAAFAGGAAGGAAADAQTMLLLGLSACGRDTTLGQAARDGIRTIYPLSLQSGGDSDAVRDGMTGSLAVVGAVLALQLVAAGVLHRRQAQHDTASLLRALARARCPAMAYRAMVLLLPGLAFGAWQEIVGAPPLPAVGGRRGGGSASPSSSSSSSSSSQTSARDLAGTALGALALVVVASLLLLGVRTVIDIAKYSCGAAQRKRSSHAGDDQNSAEEDSNTGAPTVSSPARWLPVARGYGLAFVGWPAWAREWVLPSGFWHPTLAVKVWSPVFASTRPPPPLSTAAACDKRVAGSTAAQSVSLGRLTTVMMVPTAMNARSLLVGLLLAADGVGSCRARTGLVAVLFAAGAVLVAALRPFRYRLINATAAASQASVAALTAIALPSGGDSSDDGSRGGGPDASSVRRMVLLGLAATVLGSVLAVAYVLFDRFKWRKVELAVLKDEETVEKRESAHAAGTTAEPLLQVPQEVQGEPRRVSRADHANGANRQQRRRPVPDVTSSSSPLNPLASAPGRGKDHARRSGPGRRPSTPAPSGSGDL